MGELRLIDKDTQDLAINEIAAGRTIREAAMIMGFKDPSKMHQWARSNPEFNEALNSARVFSCYIMEDMVLDVLNDPNFDPKKAQETLRIVQWMTAIRNPAVYSQRVDININQNVSIRSNIEASNAHLASILKDVTPKVIESKD